MSNTTTQALCQQCNGKGYHYANIQNLATRNYEWHIVTCQHPTCKNGKVDSELSKAYRDSWKNVSG